MTIPVSGSILLPISRSILRYLSGALVATGYLAPALGDQIATDPDLIILLGALIGIATEAFYALAKRKGWAT